MIVQVSFKGNLAKLYDYKTDLDLEKGEPVVVPTGSTFSIGIVERIIETSNRATSWVVQRVDVLGHKKRIVLREKAEIDEMLS